MLDVVASATVILGAVDADLVVLMIKHNANIYYYCHYKLMPKTMQLLSFFINTLYK